MLHIHKDGPRHIDSNIRELSFILEVFSWFLVLSLFSFVCSLAAHATEEAGVLRGWEQAYVLGKDFDVESFRWCGQYAAVYKLKSEEGLRLLDLRTGESSVLDPSAANDFFGIHACSYDSNLMFSVESRESHEGVIDYDLTGIRVFDRASGKARRVATLERPVSVSSVRVGEGVSPTSHAIVVTGTRAEVLSLVHVDLPGWAVYMAPGEPGLVIKSVGRWSETGDAFVAAYLRESDQREIVRITRVDGEVFDLGIGVDVPRSFGLHYRLSGQWLYGADPVSNQVFRMNYADYRKGPAAWSVLSQIPPGDRVVYFDVSSHLEVLFQKDGVWMAASESDVQKISDDGFAPDFSPGDRYLKYMRRPYELRGFKGSILFKQVVILRRVARDG